MTWRFARERVMHEVKRRRRRVQARAQVDAHGYWKRGVVALDHHAPLDPSDPEL